MNWSLIIVGLVALSSVAIAENSYLVIVPKLLKVGCDNQLSVFIAAAPQPVEVRYLLTIGQKRLEGKITVTAGQTRNATLTLPSEFPVGAGELTITGTSGIRFEEKRDVIVYDNRRVMLVQTSASTYRPGDMMEIRVVVTSEELTPIENGEILLEVYDAAMKRVGEFPGVPIRSGLTETIRFPIAEHNNMGSWLVSATMGNTTSSVEVFVATPITPSFDLKAIFQRFLLRTEKTLRGVIEINSDNNEPIFGRGIVAIAPITEEDVQRMTQEQQQGKPTQTKKESEQEWRKWKSQQMEIAGRVEINYDLSSMFNIDVTKCLAVQVYIQVTELASGQERLIRHIIPVFTRDVVYDIRPLEFEAGVKNEFEIIAKRPDGKPTKMEDMIVTVKMMLGNEQGKVQNEKTVEVKEFYTRGRNDIGFFTLEIPTECIGVLMTITPLGDDGKIRGYRTHAVPLMPTPRRETSGAKLTIELLPSMTEPVSTDSKTPVVSSQISTVGRTSNFYVQLLPSKSIEKFVPVPMSYVLMTNGRITRSGEFTIHPTKECQSKATRTIQPEVQGPPACVFNGTLPIQITREMVPYSTLLVYAFQPSLGFNVAESYRFSVAGLFQGALQLNATVVPYTSTSTTPEDSEDSMESSSEDIDLKKIQISTKAQDRTRVQLSYTGTPGATVGLNVIEFDGVMQGLSSEITKERLLQYLTTYEQVPIIGMPTMMKSGETEQQRKTREDEDQSGESTTTGSEKVIKKTEEITKVKTEEIENEPTKESKEKRARSSQYSKPKLGKPQKKHNLRGVVSETAEEKQMNDEMIGFKTLYPIKKMVFGVLSSNDRKSVEGDDVYSISSLERFYGDERTHQSLPHYRRKAMKSMNQYDVSVGENDYVVATSMPLIMAADALAQQEQLANEQPETLVDGSDMEQTTESQKMSRMQGSPAWFEKLHSKLSTISQEAFTFMQSGLSIVSDFETLRLPSEISRTNLTTLFSRYRQQSQLPGSDVFTDRDDARQLLEEYLIEGDSSIVPPPIFLEEQARLGYYRSVFFNTSKIESQGTGKVVLPRTKPYSTWLATGFSLHPKTGLAVAQPIRLPTNQGLFVLGNFPDKVQIGEHALLSYGINNYLGKDLSNVVIRIRASSDFDLIEQNQPDRVVSSNGKDYTVTIPTLKSLAVETRSIILVPKRAGVVKIIIEVESEFGGDYEVLTTYVRESGFRRTQTYPRLFSLTDDKKTSGPVVYKVNTSPFLRSVRIQVSGTGLERLSQRYTTETNKLIGVDRALVRLWNAISLRGYLNETSQGDSYLDEIVEKNMTTAYQKLQYYSDYDGSYSIISDEGLGRSSLLLTTMSFGALISPFMPMRDYVTINRTMSWILSRQQEDGSFEDNGPCYHYIMCNGEYRRESMTALFLYTLTRDDVQANLPEFVYRRLFEGEQSPVMRAQRYLESRLDAVKPCVLTTTLVELVLSQSRMTSKEMKEQIRQDLLSRQLTVVQDIDSKYYKLSRSTPSTTTSDEEYLINVMKTIMYANYGDYKTAHQISRWIVQRFETHPTYDSVLDSFFTTDAWILSGTLFRKQQGSDKVDLTIEVTADNGQKQQFKINKNNMDMIQKFEFTLPVNQITYTVSGYGSAGVCIRQMYVEKQQQAADKLPFKVTNEFTPMPWLSEIKTKTCVTYTPQTEQKETYNRTMVVSFQLPSGTRVNLRQLGFMLSHVENVIYFTYHERDSTLNFFINVPTTVYGKPICLEWILERLSFVSSWAPIEVTVFDYLQQESQLRTLFPIQLQPNTVGYPFVEAVQKARPSIEQLTELRKQQFQQPQRS